MSLGLFSLVAVKPVFPAHAGMSPVQSGWTLYYVRFPRSRGDEPVFMSGRERRARFSPLTRG